MQLTLNKKWKLRLGLLCVPCLAVALSGCGGSSSNSSAHALGPLLITGAVQLTPAGAALNGYTVTFDQNAKLTATTDANGSFTFSVPRSAVTGTDTLLVTNPSGTLVDTATMPANTTTLQNFDAGTLNVSPPPGPASAL